MVGLVLISDDWSVGRNCEERQMAGFEGRTENLWKKQQFIITYLVGRVVAKKYKR
ncbi:hypothetical protein SAMN05216404_108135 [Nitrosospira multiformis]|uniref:Uncharacterized protein n=1 Tax=Nitrosospira multiformis TaxID=1231 RepID=A0A1H8KGM4_9PROT|nr:hypothetical protein SAMN05216404_108135 [Nitrosospira multiformis]